MRLGHGVYHQEVTVADAPNNVQLISMPSGVDQFTVSAKGSAVNAFKIEKTYSNAADLGAMLADNANWVSVDASLDAVGATEVSVTIDPDTPTYLRVSQVTGAATGIARLTGKWRA